MMLTRLSKQIRNYATNTTKKPTSFYGYKKILDEYIYRNSLPAQWKPLVYKEKNADKLIALDAVDKHGRSIVPKKDLGVPSKYQLSKFISMFLLKDELYEIKKSIKDIDEVVENFLVPSIVDQFLIKSFEFNEFSKNLMFVDQLKNYKLTNKNLETITFIRSIQIKNNNISDIEWLNEKLEHLLKQVNLQEGGTLLYNTAYLSCLLNLKSNGSNNIDSEINSLVKKLNEMKIYEVKKNQRIFTRWDHAFSIFSELKDANKNINNIEIEKFLSKTDSFMKSVESFKNARSSFERIKDIKQEEIKEDENLVKEEEK